MNPYDELYRQFDFDVNPFGYSKGYLLWRTGQLKNEILRFIHNYEASVLDVGGGTGILGHFLKARGYKGLYVNLDPSREMLKYSPYRNIVAVGEAIPLVSESCEYVVSSDALEHVNDKAQVLKECYRVLKRGGHLILTTPRTGWKRDFILSPFILLVPLVLYKKVFRRRYRHYIPAGVRDDPSDERWLRMQLEAVGFGVLEQYRVDNHYFNLTEPFWRWFSDRFIDARKYGHCTMIVCVK